MLADIIKEAPNERRILPVQNVNSSSTVRNGLAFANVLIIERSRMSRGAHI